MPRYKTLTIDEIEQQIIELNTNSKSKPTLDLIIGDDKIIALQIGKLRIYAGKTGTLWASLQVFP